MTIGQLSARREGAGRLAWGRVFFHRIVLQSERRLGIEEISRRRKGADFSCLLQGAHGARFRFVLVLQSAPRLALSWGFVARICSGSSKVRRGGRTARNGTQGRRAEWMAVPAENASCLALVR